MANRRGEELTNERWDMIGDLVPDPVRRLDGRGHPWRDKREVMNCVLRVLRSGVHWQSLPERFPPYQTCHRRYQQWVRSGVLRSVLETLAQDLEERGELDLSECFINGTFNVAKKGGEMLERPSGVKARSSWLYQTLLVFHSLSTQRVLRHMKSPLCSILSKKVSSSSGQSV